jgi:adenosylcobinamide kinase/adenosylcobinamide-phosphate guanylyltransferase
MGRITFILGGVKSGKSHYAIKLAKRLKGKTAFIATCISADKEMKRKIELHKKSRPKHWKLVEEGKDLLLSLAKLKDRYETILIDCLGLWISNLLMENLTDRLIEKEIKNFARFISKLKTKIILVSNDVGSGVIPENFLARRFQNLIGLANQMITKIADEVIFMQSGIPIKIKDAESK